jgi:hypothetical protein
MKAKIFTLFVLGILFSSISLCRAQNILNDGNFSTTSVINSYFDQPAPDNVWYAWQNSGINNNVAVVDGVCKYDVVTLGAQKNTYDIQLAQTGFPLIQGHSYRLSFDVKADANRTFGLFLGENGGNWTSLIGYDKYTQFATTDWKTITIDFVATSVFYNHKLSFELGAEQVVTYFDNVMLVDIPNVWLTGSAFGGWVESGMIKLSTTDGVTYTATNIEILGDGGGTSEFKFTEGTWPTAAGPLGGPPGFPSGIASVTESGSPNMRGVPGSWNVTYNYLTKEYSFTPGINPYRAISFEGTAFPAGAILSTADGIKFSRESFTLGVGTGQFVEKPSDITPSPTANWSSIDFPIGTGTQDGTLLAVAAGTYNANFNIATGAYNFQPTTVSIIGEFSSWVGDVDMTTTDNITWTLSGFVFYSGGSLKFRDNHNWNYNYGSATGTEFPAGTGISISPFNIPYEAGTYDITFNRTTLAYTFKCLNCPTHIGLIGSAVPPNYNAGPDVNMFTNDNIIFTLPDYTFTSGEAKFRQDDSWDTNWGNTTFPTGTAVQNGPSIPVTAGTYNATFNIKTGDYSFTAPSPIGIIGDALYGWDFDVDMQSTDGITYTLLNYPFINGYIKFRQDNNWNVSWGGWEFPTGTADQLYGGNIYVPVGNYNVTFNKLTGDYSFVATTCPFPAIQCPWVPTVNSEPGKCGAVVNYPPVVAAATCGGEGITITQTAGLPSGSFFPVGSTWNAFELTNTEGKTTSCGFYVYVNDPPKIKKIPDLWPPNHKMVPIHFDFENNCDGNITVLYYYIYNITSNEPDNGLGDGDVANDWQIDMNGQNLLLRAERSGKGKGRVYSFNVYGYDESYNWFEQIVTVTVPHDKGKEVSLATNPATNHESSISGNSFENVSLKSTVWPNPSTNSFNLVVQSASNEKVVLTVFDLNGHLLSNLDANSNQTTTFGKDLKAGTYLVLVRQGNNSNTIKVVKQ